MKKILTGKNIFATFEKIKATLAGKFSVEVCKICEYGSESDVVVFPIQPELATAIFWEGAA